MRVFVICAHPDDESLGCGGTIARHAGNGDEVHCIVMANNFRSPDIAKHFDSAMKILGVREYKLVNLPDSQLENFPLIYLAQEIEQYTKQNGIPDIVYTHHFDELSQDHRIVYWVTMVAFRPIWGKPVSIFSFDAPSSTEWSGRPFMPDMFVDITEHIGAKIDACRCYETEFRKSPHPRSKEGLESRARYWGAYCGVEYAEAFKVVREVR